MRSLWQCFVAAIVLATLVMIGISIVRPADGYAGLTLHSDAGHFIVDSVEPGSKAALAGIRVGESLTIANTLDDDIRLEAPRVGDSVVVTRANGAHVILAAVPISVPIGILIVVSAARVAFLLVAAIIAWRLPEDRAARALVAFLLCYGLGLRVGSAFWGPPLLRFIDFMLNEPFFIVGTGALALFTSRYPTRAISGIRRAFERAIVPAVILGVVLSATRLTTLLIFHSRDLFRPLLTVQVFVLVGMLAGAVVSLIISYRGSTGEDRVRVLWVIRTFAAGFSGLVPMLVLVSAGYLGQGVQYLALTIVLIPVGLAYVILRHRVLDIGFVINRAVVYAIFSFVLVGSFIIVEWLIGNVVELQGRTSTVLQLAAALALGMSSRFIHARVDAFVDDLLFRERHQAEAAIRRFAQEALLITDPNDLIAKTVAVAERNARLSGAAYYVRRGGDFASAESTFAETPKISENDYAVLAMRAWHKSVDLGDHQTELPGEVAFPMMVRGELSGFLLCGDKTSHEALAPDERDALAQLARDSGIALDSLQIQELLRTAERRAERWSAEPILE
jgi:hypothetical protein